MSEVTSEIGAKQIQPSLDRMSAIGDVSGLALHREWPPDCYAHGLRERS
jgi:hypothetical protein